MSSPSSSSYDVVIDWLPRSDLLNRFVDWRYRREEAKETNGTSWLSSSDAIGDAGGAELLIFPLLLMGTPIEWVVSWLVLPVLLFAADWLVVGGLVPVGVFSRIVLRRPWTVLVSENRDDKGAPEEAGAVVVDVTGWRRALRTRDAIAHALTTGASVTAATSVRAN